MLRTLAMGVLLPAAALAITATWIGGLRLPVVAMPEPWTLALVGAGLIAGVLASR